MGGGGGGILIFSYLHRLGSFFGVQNFEFQYFLGFSEIFFWGGGMKILWIFFEGRQKFDYIKGSFLCILGPILKIMVQNGDIFFGC